MVTLVAKNYTRNDDVGADDDVVCICTYMKIKAIPSVYKHHRERQFQLAMHCPQRQLPVFVHAM